MFCHYDYEYDLMKCGLYSYQMMHRTINKMSINRTRGIEIEIEIL